MRKIIIAAALSLLAASGTSAEPIVKSILRTALDPQNHGLISGLVVRIREDSDVSYDVAEEVYIRYPDFTLPDLEDDFDLIIPMQDAYLVGDALLLREQTVGMIVHIAVEDIAAAFPIIRSSSAFQRFVEHLDRSQ